MPRANNNKNNKRKRPPLPINGIASRTRRLPIDGIASSTTRRQTNDIAAAWDIPIPITIGIISWIDQESLINLSLVSKQMHDIIRNEPGNKNKIISVFEVRGSSTLKLFRNLRGYFLDEKTKKRLQSYHIMTFKDPYKYNYDAHKYSHDAYLSKLLRMLKKHNVQMHGITSLIFSSPSRTLNENYCSLLPVLPSIIMKILPKLREVDLSGTIVDNRVLRKFSKNCPVLEKVVAWGSFNHKFRVAWGPFNHKSSGISLSGRAMSHSRYLKEIHMNNVKFDIQFRDGNQMSDLNNHREIFLFHHCCEALEHVSILNMKFGVQHPFLSTFIQNILIKFVRNVPSLRWFRSDLTSENMTMLRRERPDIELLN